jgi:carbon monoxide dehydrogenase subunit G
MVKVELSVTINRLQAEVFAFITNPANNAKWQEGLVESRLVSSGSVGVGSQITDVRKFLGRDMESKLEVSAYEPNKKFAQKVVSGPLQFEIIQTLEPSGDGTKISLVAQGEPGGFFKLAEGMVQKQLQSQLEGDADRLKKLLEG